MSNSDSDSRFVRIGARRAGVGPARGSTAAPSVEYVRQRHGDAPVRPGTDHVAGDDATSVGGMLKVTATTQPTRIGGFRSSVVVGTFPGDPAPAWPNRPVAGKACGAGYFHIEPGSGRRLYAVGRQSPAPRVAEVLNRCGAAPDPGGSIPKIPCRGLSCVRTGASSPQVQAWRRLGPGIAVWTALSSGRSG